MILVHVVITMIMVTIIGIIICVFLSLFHLFPPFPVVVNTIVITSVVLIFCNDDDYCHDDNDSW